MCQLIEKWHLFIHHFNIVRFFKKGLNILVGTYFLLRKERIPVFFHYMYYRLIYFILFYSIVLFYFICIWNLFPESHVSGHSLPNWLHNDVTFSQDLYLLFTFLLGKNCSLSWHGFVVVVVFKSNFSVFCFLPQLSHRLFGHFLFWKTKPNHRPNQSKTKTKQNKQTNKKTN